MTWNLPALVAFLETPLAVSSESLAVALPLTDLWLFSTSRSCRKTLMVGLGPEKWVFELRMVRSTWQGLHLQFLGATLNRLLPILTTDCRGQQSSGCTWPWRLEAPTPVVVQWFSLSEQETSMIKEMRMRMGTGCEADEIRSSRGIEEVRRTGPSEGFPSLCRR